MRIVRILALVTLLLPGFVQAETMRKPKVKSCDVFPQRYVLDFDHVLKIQLLATTLKDTEFYVPEAYLAQLKNAAQQESSLSAFLASDVLRLLENAVRGKDIHSGIALENGNRLYFKDVKRSAADPALDLAQELSASEKSAEFLTNLNALRLRARLMKIKPAENLRHQIEPEDSFRGVYSGAITREVTERQFAKIAAKDELLPSEIPGRAPTLYGNEFVHLVDKANNSFVGRYNPVTQKIVRLPELGKGEHYTGITPKNIEQRMLVDLLLDPNIQLVTVNGGAGTGKTLVAMAVALHLHRTQQIEDKIMISRPPIESGQSLGYLPGDMHDKLDPYIKSFHDNFEVIEKAIRPYALNAPTSKTDIKRSWAGIGPTGGLESYFDLVSIGHARGASLQKKFWIIDEAQLLTPAQIKLIITRAGFGTKIVLLGDDAQVDATSGLTSDTNGLSLAINRMRGPDPDSLVVGHITLREGERSPLANRALDKL